MGFNSGFQGLKNSVRG